MLCIAGGSGIAGMMSILGAGREAGHFAGWDGHVFFGVRTVRDGFFLDELQAFRAPWRVPALRHDRALGRGCARRPCAAAYPGLTFARGLVHAVAASA